MPKSSKQAVKIININTASQSELASLQALGAARAKDLAAYRKNNGPFDNWEALKKVPGFSSKLIDDIKKSGAVLESVEEEGGEEEW